MAGLFSLPTPDAVRANAAQQASQRAGLFSQAPRGRAGVAAAAQSGGLFGEALGRAAGGTAPGETEAIAQQQVQQLVAQQVEQQGLNLSDPQDYVKMTEIAANAFNKLGMSDMAAKAAEQGLAVQVKFKDTNKAKVFADIDVEKFTPESIARFEQTGRRSDLVVRKEDPKKSLSVGEEAIDKAFADTFVDWTTGGSADVEKNLLQLKQAQQRLESGEENLTGSVIGNTPDIIKQQVNPASIDVRDTVEEVVQRNLRLVLGAQFTQKEGERLIARAYNEKLDEDINAKRVGRLVDAIQKAAEAKQAAVDYYDRNGTLKGFKGKQFSLDDIEAELEKGIQKEEEKNREGWSIRRKGS